MMFLPTAGCIPRRTGGDRAAQKRRHLEHRSRWCSSTLSPQPSLCSTAGWGELRMRSCSPSLATALPKAVARCKMEMCHGHWLSQGGQGRGGEGRKKCPAPGEGHPAGSPSPTARPTGTPGARFPHSSPPLLRARPAVPGCLNQAGPGKHRGWLRDGHRELLTAAPKAPPSTRRSLARRSTPRRHARQESRHEPGWTRLCRRPNISSQGREVTIHHVTSPFTPW